jgi:general secretion pathway protein D
VRIPFATGSGIGFTGLAAGIFRENFNVPFLVSMLETHTTAKLITNASVLTNDNQQSTIEVGRTINILRTESSQSPTDPGRVTAGDEVEANLTLAISPRISNDNYLRLDIELVVDAFQGQGDPSLNIPPPRTHRSFSGSVTVPNGRTVVIGGLLQQDSVQSVSMVPFLGEIPIIGELFKSTTDSHTNTTLYLFVTPTIIRDFRLLEEISYARKLELFKLNGDIRLVDPDFRVRGIEDFDVDLESLEQTGMLDMPNYQPMTPISEGAKLSIPSR